MKKRNLNAFILLEKMSLRFFFRFFITQKTIAASLIDYFNQIYMFIEYFIFQKSLLFKSVYKNIAISLSLLIITYYVSIATLTFNSDERAFNGNWKKTATEREIEFGKVLNSRRSKVSLYFNADKNEEFSSQLSTVSLIYRKMLYKSPFYNFFTLLFHDRYVINTLMS